MPTAATRYHFGSLSPPSVGPITVENGDPIDVYQINVQVDTNSLFIILILSEAVSPFNTIFLGNLRTSERRNKVLDVPFYAHRGLRYEIPDLPTVVDGTESITIMYRTTG